jgi:nitrite reductase/ring-hydroxylating ferredoxin subunit
MTTPAWKRAFPIAWSEDDLVNRRAFAQSLFWVSGAAFLANAALLGRAAAKGEAPLPEKNIGRADALPVGGARVFHYPDESEPCLLVRLTEERFVAVAQRCTHLGCPVQYRPAAGELHCPCHEGRFDAATGAVRSGPPLRPLPMIALERRGDELWAVGVRS